MTRLDPSLSLRRLVVTRDGKIAYGERFHSGVNIIRGSNSSGKSTIADLIFFALGGEGVHWKPEALLCDSVFAEVELNGEVASFRRDIEEKRASPMFIFWGDLDSAFRQTAGWEKYPFARSENKESFSQVLFRRLGMPSVKSDGSSNLTMHQLLRVMYADQETPGARLFRLERIDSALIRETVGDFLLGVYSDALYRSQLELDEANKEFEVKSRQLRDMYAILSKADQYETVEELRGKIAEARAERQRLHGVLQDQRNERTAKEVAGRVGESAKRFRQRLEAHQAVSKKISDAEQKLSDLRLAIADSDQFIDAIRIRLGSLDEAVVIRRELGSFLFQYCPACLVPISEVGLDEGHCPLCRSAAPADEANRSSQRMRNQLEMQLKESMKLQERRKSDLAATVASMPEMYAEQERVAQQYAEEVTNPSSDLDATIEDTSRQIGSIDRLIENLIHREKLFGLLESLIAEKGVLNSRISELTDKVAIEKAERDRRKQAAYLKISERTASLLHRDLNRQEAFAKADVVDFDFGADRVTVDGEQNFSASSMVVLRNLAHLALLWVSVDDPKFRFPRFLLMDALEEGGMEVMRSHKMQNLIVETSQSIGVEHQIIFTTSEIDDDLELSTLTVGQHYGPDLKSLAIG